MNPDNITQTMPSVKEMVENGYTVRHWLNYYLNIWKRQAAACAIDVYCDQLRKKDNPEMQVEQGQQVIPVKERLEHRKIKLQDALDVIAGAEALLEIPEAEFETKIFSKEALAVAEDMLPKPFKKYTVIGNDLSYSGNTFKVGAVVEFTEEEAAPLLAGKSIEEKIEEEKKKEEASAEAKV